MHEFYIESSTVETPNWSAAPNQPFMAGCENFNQDFLRILSPIAISIRIQNHFIASNQFIFKRKWGFFLIFCSVERLLSLIDQFVCTQSRSNIEWHLNGH